MGESDNYESLSLISIDLIEWTDTIVSDPSFTVSVTRSDIRKMIESYTFSGIKILDLPCHTQKR